MANPIRAELETRLNTFAVLNNIPVAWEGLPFTKPSTGGYLECYILSASTINPTVDGKRSREVGLMQVNVYFPDGTGSQLCDDMANAIIAAFPVVPKTGSVSIEQTPNAAKATPDNSGWRWVPVTIKYRYES